MIPTYIDAQLVKAFYHLKAYKQMLYYITVKENHQILKNDINLISLRLWKQFFSNHFYIQEHHLPEGKTPSRSMNILRAFFYLLIIQSILKLKGGAWILQNPDGFTSKKESPQQHAKGYTEGAYLQNTSKSISSFQQQKKNKKLKEVYIKSYLSKDLLPDFLPFNLQSHSNRTQITGFIDMNI